MCSVNRNSREIGGIPRLRQECLFFKSLNGSAPAQITSYAVLNFSRYSAEDKDEGNFVKFSGPIKLRDYDA